MEIPEGRSEKLTEVLPEKMFLLTRRELMVLQHLTKGEANK
jgi:DNA-binding NarL/FixJ family response regulator